MEQEKRFLELDYLENYKQIFSALENVEILENQFATYIGGFKKDYGVIKKVRTEPKINRNSLCPCDSGLKYKKCCINK